MSDYYPDSLFYYRPNLVAAIICAVLFGISGIVHAYQSHRYKLWRVTGVLPYCAAVFVAGFAIRAVCHNDSSNLGLFIGSQICVLIAPPLYALCLYFVLARALYYVPWLSPIHPGRVRTTFVGFDLLCGVLLGAGAGRFGNTSLSNTEREVGSTLVKVGMLLQCILMPAFITLTAVFHRRCAQHGIAHKLKWIFVLLYVCAALIWWRSIFRTVEFFQGYLGNIYTHEVYFYCLDILEMLLVTTILHVLHPGRFLVKSYKIYLAKDGVTEIEGPGWDDKRNFCVTCLDPFDLFGLFSGRDKQSRFWENDAVSGAGTQDNAPKEFEDPFKGTDRTMQYGKAQA